MDGIMVAEVDGPGRGGDARTLAVIVSGEPGHGLVDVVVPYGASVRVLVEVMATRGGHVGEEAFVFVDDADEPLALEVVVDEAHPHRRRHHVHRRREVEVIVNYGGGRAYARFSPATRVERVLRWAVAQFPEIDATLASELELKVADDGSGVPEDQRPELPVADNVGQHVPHGEGRIELDLTRGVIANGAPM